VLSVHSGADVRFMNVLYLYAEVMGYTMATIKALVGAGATVHLVHWDHRKLTPFRLSGYPDVHVHPRSIQTHAGLRSLAQEVAPDITVVSGWQDQAYLSVARSLRKQRRRVVCTLDGQWHGRPRQYVAAVLGRCRYFSRYFSHAWVAGVYQYEYARKLGFTRHEIVFDLYSADTSLFETAYECDVEKKAARYPHRFVFVGRFEHIKGLDTLLRAWHQLGPARGDWELHVIGNGSLRDQLAATEGIVVKDFMQPDKLVQEVAAAGCLVLPSRGEPWGVVVHEFAAAGVPLIVSDVVGAASAFLVPGMNGYRFIANSAAELARAMEKIVAQPDAALAEMGRASHVLGHRITPDTSVSNLLSLLVS
jgi:glycosyltransferase involved in cell wall biosynthesis